MTADLTGMGALHGPSSAVDPATAMLRAARVLIREGRTEEALQQLAAASHAASRRVDALNEAAAAYLELGRPERALQTLRPLLAQNMATVGTFELAARALLAQGNSTAARLILEEGVVTHPASLRIKTLLASVLFQHLEDHRAARDILTALLARCPGNLEARFMLVICCARLGELDEAVRQGERLLEDDPANALVCFLLSRLAARLGRLSEALVHARRAVELAPEDANFRANLARVRSRAANPHRPQNASEAPLHHSPQFPLDRTTDPREET